MAASRVWESRLLGFCPINYSVHVDFMLGAVVATVYAGMGSITFESNILQLQLLCIGPITITITITFENHHPYYNYNYF